MILGGHSLTLLYFLLELHCEGLITNFMNNLFEAMEARELSYANTKEKEKHKLRQVEKDLLHQKFCALNTAQAVWILSRQVTFSLL